MTEDEKSKGWWHTVPGILTAIAGVVTAVTGLIVALNQIGVFDRDEKQKAKSTPSEETRTAPPVRPIPSLPKAPSEQSTRPTQIPPDVSRQAGDTSTSVLVPVPDVRGLSLDVASSRLADAQLRVGRKSFYTLGRYKPGTIYEQKTAPGARVPSGTAIGLSIEREKPLGIQSSGQIYLSPRQVWDLDGEMPTARENMDIGFDAISETERYLKPHNGAVIGAVGRTRVGRDGCAAASLSNSPIRLEIGAYLCVRTNRGRYSLLRIDDLSRELTLSFDTWLSGAQGTEGRQVRLSNRDSYHFLRGVRGSVQGGDFYVTIADNGAAMFYANNREQRGLVDLGDIGNVALNDVSVPKSGYYQFGVPVVVGHTYVSLSRTGEEGHFVVFRVDRVTSDSVILSYTYR